MSSANFVKPGSGLFLKTKPRPDPKPALLVIDVQRYFFERGARAFIEAAPAIVPNIVKLVDAFRCARLPVVFTRHAHKRGEPTGQMGRWWADDLPWEGTSETELIGEIGQKSGEVITKTRYSAFEDTDLETKLRDWGVVNVVICGVMTNVCIETTARHAFMKDFQPIVVEDACVGKSPEHHAASLLNLSYAFAVIEKTDGIIEGLKVF